MTISAKLAFRNSASTEDLNATIAKIVDRGIFWGGALGLSPISLNLTIDPFVAVGYDGMVSISDATETVTVIDGQVNYIVLFAKYEHRATPITTLQVISSSEWTSSSFKDYLITFARVDLSAGGYSGVTPAQVFYDDSDWADRLGKGSWRSSVATTGDLPTLYNRDGDTRMVTSGYKPYVWKVATATWVPAYDSDASLVAYDGGPVWHDGTTNPATTVETQLDKIITDLIGTTGGGGGDKLGIGARSSWLDAATNPAGSIFDAADKIITDLKDVTGSGGANKIGVGARTAWYDTTANPSTSVFSALNKVVTDLVSTSGSSRIGSTSSSGSPYTLPVGSIKSQLYSLLLNLNSTYALALSAYGSASALWASNWRVALSLSGSETFSGVDTDGDMTVVLQANSGNIYYSYDNINWTLKAVDGGSYFSDIRYGNGYWVLCGGFGGTNNLMYATDPTGSWTANNQGAGTFNAVEYGDGYWYIVGSSGAAYYKSTDPVGAWTSNTTGSSALYDVTYCPGDHYWVVVGAAGSLYYRLTDPAGAFTAHSTVSPDILYAVNYGYSGGSLVWVTVGASNYIYTASVPTGAWTSRTSAAQSGANLYDVSYGSNVFCICSATSTGKYRGIQLSVDGINWTNKVVPYVTGNITALRYCGDMFVACTNDDNAAVLTSLRKNM